MLPHVYHLTACDVWATLHLSHSIFCKRDPQVDMALHRYERYHCTTWPFMLKGWSFYICKLSNKSGSLNCIMWPFKPYGPLTWARPCLLLATRYKCLTFVPDGGSARYECAGLTFIPGRATTRYKCGFICIRPNFAPVKKISHPLSRTPPRLSPLFSLPLTPTSRYLPYLFFLFFLTSVVSLSLSLIYTGARGAFAGWRRARGSRPSARGGRRLPA
jgi:hypothetical protein